MLPVFLVFAVSAFASGFALRTIDPLVIPIAHHFAMTPSAAALLSTAYALPYALAQPFLGPLGDRFGKRRCIQVCIALLAVALLLGAIAPTFAGLLATRVAAGIVAGGLIPLVLAGLGDAYDMSERQVMIGRMLVAIITGQLLGSTGAGLANALFGWRRGLAVAAATALVAAGLAWFAIAAPARADLAPARVQLSIAALYGHVFDNPKAIWLYAAVVAEGALIFGAFPFIGQLLIERTGSSLATAPSRAGFVLGAFGIGGLAYAISVRRVIDLLGVRRMCIVGAVAAALSYAALVVFASWWLDALAMMVAGLSYYMLHNSLQTEATEIAPAARGSAVALFACGLFAGQGIGPLVFGALVHAFGFPVALLGSSVGILLLGRLVVRRIIPMGDASS